MRIDTLAECVLADEEGQSLGIGSAIGHGAVGAYAGVGEGVLEVGSVATLRAQQDGLERYLLGHRC